MSERFYTNWPLAPGMIDLTGPEAHHLAVVCRLRPNAQVCLFNGDGHEYPARVVAVSKRLVQLEVQCVDAANRELPFVLEIAAPLPKGDRGQMLVEKLTELGVTSYVPLLTERSVIQPREGKIGKLERYVIEASKQCGRNVLMQVAEPVIWEKYLGRGAAGELKLLGHPQAASSLAWPRDSATVRCAVGPEGGFSEEEVRHAQAAGWQLLDLGPRILRIETAALAMALRAVYAREFGS